MRVLSIRPGRLRGKSDTVDAEAAARAALNGEARVTPKSQDGIVESIRALRVAFTSARGSRAGVINQIGDLIVAAPGELRNALEALSTSERIARLGVTQPTQWRAPSERCVLSRAATVPDTSQLRTARQNANLSLQTVATALGTWPIRISKIERGITHDTNLTHRYQALLATKHAT